MPMTYHGPLADAGAGVLGVTEAFLLASVRALPFSRVLVNGLDLRVEKLLAEKAATLLCHLYLVYTRHKC